MKTNQIILAVIIAVLVGAAGFFGGMQYQKSQRGNMAQFGGAGRFARNGGGQNANMQPVRGQIISADSNSITVKMQNGSSKIVLLNGSTAITQSASATASDLQVGKQVLVLGTSNSDGSVTASNVSLNPTVMFGGRGGGNSPSPTSSPSGY